MKTILQKMDEAQFHKYSCEWSDTTLHRRPCGQQAVTELCNRGTHVRYLCEQHHNSWRLA